MYFYLGIFISGGLCGWMIDTAYRTWHDGRYVPNTWIPFFSIIYGLAAVLLYILFNFFSISFIAHVVIGAIVAIYLELISGMMALIFLGRRFWNYSSNKFNLYGFIDIQHSFYWLILATLYRAVYTFLFWIILVDRQLVCGRLLFSFGNDIIKAN